METKLAAGILTAGLVGVAATGWLVWKLGEKAVEYHNEEKERQLARKALAEAKQREINALTNVEYI